MGDQHGSLATLRQVPQTVWVLGLVSLFMDVSSESIHGLLPVFLVGTLGASPALLGLIEGVAEGTASISKVVSGPLSDRLGRRKGLMLLGYGLAAASKLIFPFARSAAAVLAARFIDRIGKGCREAPRDALIADITPAGLRGAAYGLRQSLDTLGGLLGPLSAIGLMALLHNDARAVFRVAVLPAAISVLILLFFVREPSPAGESPLGGPRLRWSDVLQLPVSFWATAGVGMLFTFARFSEAFLVLRCADAGLGIALSPFVLIVMNLVYAGAAAPLGSLSDRLGRKRLLALGMAVLVVADLVLALDGSLMAALGGVALWGLHMALTQGLLAALVADTAPARLRGTAFGAFNLASGVALLAASGLAGLLWQRAGAPATFLAGGGFAAAGLIGALALIKETPTTPASGR
jgi:MFS family permease